MIFPNSKSCLKLASQQYVRLAHACSLIYLMLSQLNEIHFLYNYYLDFLLDIFKVSLSSPQLSGVAGYNADANKALKKLPYLNHQQIVALIKLITLPGFKDVISRIESIPDFKDWLKSDNPETLTPEVYETTEPLTDIG
uniref:Restriction endonuclease subunit S n=1 Tax=Strongyloides papillosus TaxID=174720 RepID=A0A0N5CI94_STREA